MKIFKGLSIASVLTAYFSIYINSLSRISRADSGYFNWHKCLGESVNTNQLLLNSNNNINELALPWIKYINCYAGIAICSLVTILFIWAIVRYYNRLRILIPAAIAAILIAFQIWQGGINLPANLEPIRFSVHIFASLILISMLLFISQQMHYMVNPDTEKDSVYSNKAQAWVIVIWVFTVIQIILGMQLREAIELAYMNHPLHQYCHLISKVGAIKYAHPLFGILTSFFIMIITRRLITSDCKPSDLVWQSCTALHGLTILQLIIGIVIVFVDMSQVARVLHLWVAGLIMGMLVVTYTALSHKREGENV